MLQIGTFYSLSQKHKRGRTSDDILPKGLNTIHSTKINTSKLYEKWEKTV